VATIQLKLGDMFDGPSDLIVLPCSTAGTITSFVRERLIHHRIPYPNPGMKLGDVVVLPFEGGENIAQFVAYAASVEEQSSTREAIKRIGKQLGTTRERPTIRRVSAPELGTRNCEQTGCCGALPLHAYSLILGTQPWLVDGSRATLTLSARVQSARVQFPIWRRSGSRRE
jgi:hypothetical protein